MKLNIDQAFELVTDCFMSNVVPMLAGSPGVGKSALAKMLCEHFSLELIDLRLSQCDPTDLLGFPTVDKVSGRASYMPMSTFPLEQDVPPVGKNGWLLLLDELPSAPMAVQAASYRLVLDREIGEHKLNKKVVIMCAGNLATDNAIVNRLSTAMESRMAHLELGVDFDIWMKWATANNLDYRVTAFLNFRPELLHNFDPQHSDKTFACPRTWHMAARLVKRWKGTIPDSKFPLLAGTLSEGVAGEFVSFCEVFGELPSIDDLALNPEATPVPDNPSTLYALSSLIGNKMDKDNATVLLKYVKRLPIEFQVTTLRETTGRDAEMLKHPALRNWIARNAQEFF